MKPFNILFINIPPISVDIEAQYDSTSTFYVYPPIGLLSLASQLYGKDCVNKIGLLDYSIFDLPEFKIESDYDRFIKDKIKGVSQNIIYDIICVSVMFSLSYDFFKKVITEAHSLFNKSLIICGGIHATNSTEFIFDDNKYVDYIIRGEAEIALPLLLDKLYSDQISTLNCSIQTNIKGVISRDMYFSGNCFSMAEMPVNIDVDFNVYSKIIDMEMYTNKVSLFSLTTSDIHRKAFPVMASRGCPVSCTFCASRTVHGKKPRWRTLANIREEICFLNKEYGVTKIYLMDDNFTPKRKAIDLFEMISELNIEDLDVVIQSMSVNHTDFDIIDSIVKAQIKYVPLAIESGSPEMQKKIKKFCNLDKAAKLVEYAQQKGLQVRCFYIVGFPEETIAEINETINVAQKIGTDWSTFNVAGPFPGTEMYDEFVKLGYIEDTPESWKATTLRDRIFDTKEFSSREIKKIAQEANLKVNFVNSPYIAKRRFQEGKIVFENFLYSFEFHIFAYDSLRRINLELGNIKEAQICLTKMKNLLKTNPKSAEFEQYFYLLDKEIVDAMKA